MAHNTIVVSGEQATPVGITWTTAACSKSWSELPVRLFEDLVVDRATIFIGQVRAFMVGFIPGAERAWTLSAAIAAVDAGLGPRMKW